MKARPSRSRKPAHATKHPGIYGKPKEIIPAPKSAHLTVNLPIEYMVALQDKYPTLSHCSAVKQYILDTVTPVNPKEILR